VQEDGDEGRRVGSGEETSWRLSGPKLRAVAPFVVVVAALNYDYTVSNDRKIRDW
jgi:hypothetical protein